MIVSLLCLISLVYVLVDGNGSGVSCKHLERDGFGGASVDLSQFIIVVPSYATNNGKMMDKRQQYFNGIAVFDALIVVRSDADGSNPVAIRGNAYQSSDFDSLGTTPSISEDAAVQLIIDPANIGNIDSKVAALNFYVDHENADTPYLMWVISVGSFADGYSWRGFVDALTGTVFKKLDTMEQVTIKETGGNEKIGATTYTFTTPALSLENDKVFVADYATPGTTITCAADGADCVDDAVNGAYGPAGDAFEFGNAVVQLFNDWAWGLTPVSPSYMPLHCVVHMTGEWADNAYWWNGELVFGDGETYFYPLTAIDVVAHEAAHGFTEYNSDLVYEKESGGMNEAYSDLAGEAMEVYSKGYTNWELGNDITTQAFIDITGGPALRYMYDPSIDGVSVDEWSEGTTSLDPHYSSGVYNKMFYLLSAYGWSVKDIFQVTTKANQIYWTPESTMAEGACGMIDAAVDLFGEDQNRIYALRTAFRTVNIECGDLNIVQEEDDLSATQGNTLEYTYENTDDRLLRFVADGGSGEATLSVKFGSRPAADGSDADCTEIFSFETAECVFDEASRIGTWYVAIVAITDFVGVSFAVEKPPVDVSTCQDELPSDEASWTVSDVHRGGPDWTLNADDTWTSNCNAPAWRQITMNLAQAFDDPCDYDDFITITAKAQGDQQTYLLEVAFQNDNGVTVASDDTGHVDLSSGTAQEVSLTYDNKLGLATQVTITEHAGAGTILTVPVVTLPISCAFSPRAQEDAWQVTSGGDGWSVNQVEKTWTASDEASTRAVTLELSDYCPLQPQYLTVIGRVRGFGSLYAGEYRLQIQFKDSSGAVIGTEDTGPVSPRNNVEEYILSYDNTAGEVTQITITESGKDLGDNAGNFGPVLQIPIIRVSDRDDTPYDAELSARHVHIKTDPGYDPKKPDAGPKITLPNTVMDNDKIKDPFVREHDWNEKKAFKLLDEKMTHILYLVMAMFGLMAFAVFYGMCCGFNAANPARFKRTKNYSFGKEESEELNSDV